MSSSEFPPVEERIGEFTLLKSVSQLDNLSSAISTFTSCFNELQNHLDSILASLQSPPQKEDVILSEQPPPPTDAPDDRSELQRLCDSMDSRRLRKYVSRHLSDDAGKLRDEVSDALKRAPNLPRLVLDCIGRFYLQGVKAFAKSSVMVTVRQACILILEVFLASGCSEIEESIHEEAKTAAIAWKSRLVQEGGIDKSGSEDALALLLFVMAFSIPSEFERGDLCKLIRVCRAHNFADILHHSSALLERIRDVIQGLVNKRMHVEAVGLSCAFSLNDEFSPLALVENFVKEITQKGADMRKEGQCSFRSLIEANQKQIAGLKSVVKCFQDYKLDPEKLASWKIDAKIAKLEKDISKFEDKLGKRAIKRKGSEHGSSEKMDIQQTKRYQSATSRFSSPRTASAVRMPSWEQNLYKELPPRTMFDGRYAGSLDEFSGSFSQPDPLLSNGSNSRLMAGNDLGGHGAGVAGGIGPSAGSSVGQLGLYAEKGVGLYAGVGSGLSHSSGLVTEHGVASAGSGGGLYSVNDMGTYSAVGRELPTGNSFEPFTDNRIASAGTGGGLYAGNGVGSFHVGNGLPAGNSAGPFTDDRIASYGWHGNAAFNDNSVGQSFPGLPSTAVQSYMGSYASAVPSHGVSGPDMYQFADTLEREYGSSHTHSTAPTSAPSYPTSQHLNQ